MSAGFDVFLRVLPSILLFLTLIWCCCRADAPNSTHESEEARQERKERIEATLITRRVVEARKQQQHGGVAQRLTSSDRAYSSYLSAVMLPRAASGSVKFSEEEEESRQNDARLEQAEEGTATRESNNTNTTAASVQETAAVEESKQEQQSDHPAASPHAAAVHFSDSTLVQENAALPSQQLVSDGPDSLRTSNRTEGSWIPSASSSSSSSSYCSSSIRWEEQQAATTVHSSRSSLSSTTRPPVVTRRKSNLLARTLSRSLRSLSSINSNGVQEESSCDVCLMEYQVGEEVCSSPNVDCRHVFHKTCIVTWLLQSSDANCPVCRRDYLHISASSRDDQAERRKRNRDNHDSSTRQEQPVTSTAYDT